MSTPNAFVFNDVEQQTAYGVYLTDQMDLTEQFKFRLGGRYDWFKQQFDDSLAALQPPKQDVTKFSPSAGVIYELTDGLSFYGAYAQGFRPNTGFDVQRNPFEPEETESYEVGMKFTALGSALSGTIAVFTMDKTNVITADPVNSGHRSRSAKRKARAWNSMCQANCPRNSGFSCPMPTPTPSPPRACSTRTSARSSQAGDPLINIPKHNASVLLFKDFDISGRTLTFGAGAKYFSKRLGETGTDFYLPDYTLVRLLGSFDVTENLKISAEVNNLSRRGILAGVLLDSLDRCGRAA